MKKTNLFGVIGFPLGHSHSPQLHNFWIKKKKIKAIYKKFPIRENGLKNIIKKIKNKKIIGLNVTTPHKIKVLNFLDNLKGDAKITKSVNTIFYKDGKIIGENTDVYGIEKGFLQKIKKINKKTVFILGAGGVVPSIILALQNHKVKKIILCNRNISKINKIKKLFKKNFLGIGWEKRNKYISRGDVIFNATSLGMKKKPNLYIDTNKVKRGATYCEIVYNPVNTKTIKKFKKIKIKTLNGLDMFIYQAEKSFFLWHNQRPRLTLKEKRKIFNKLL